MATRSGLAALIGAANAGKSTLFNRLVGERLSIVTPKPQTTRLPIQGVVLLTSRSGDRAEIVVVDLPGIIPPRREPDRAMVAAAWRGAATADVVLFVVDAKRGASALVQDIGARLARLRRPIWLVLNKVDLARKERLLPLSAALNAGSGFGKTFMVSARSGDGVADIAAALAAAMPEGPHLYPEDQISDLSERSIAAEIVREQVLRQSGDEVPYAAAVETESWQEHADGSVRVSAVISVARAGQKAILIGAGGRRVRGIGSEARKMLAQLLGRKVHLVLRVALRPGGVEGRERLAAPGMAGDRPGRGRRQA